MQRITKNTTTDPFIEPQLTKHLSPMESASTDLFEYKKENYLIVKYIFSGYIVVKNLKRNVETNKVVKTMSKSFIFIF